MVAFSHPLPFLIPTIAVALSCGTISGSGDRSNKSERTPPVIRATAETPMALTLDGYAPGSFSRVPAADRCSTLEKFLKSYHDAYLAGTEMSSLDGMCTGAEDGTERSYRLDFSVSRKTETLDFAFAVAVDSEEQIRLEFAHVVAGEGQPWKPKSEPFILHSNLSHIERSLAAYLGVD